MLPAPEVLDETLAGRTLLFKWASEGWCWGEVTRQNTDRHVKVGGVAANYCACYEIDGPGSEAKHHLKLDNYLDAKADPNSNGQAGATGDAGARHRHRARRRRRPPSPARASRRRRSIFRPQGAATRR